MNTPIPHQVSEKILGDIKKKLNPDIKKLLSKVFIIHIATAVITLSICPQFGLALFRSHFNLMDTFMKIGPHFCDFLCGAFFTTCSMATNLLILSRDELRAIKFQKFLMTSILVLSSVGFLIMLNREVFIQLSFLWIIGLILGVLVTFDLGIRMLNFKYPLP